MGNKERRLFRLVLYYDKSTWDFDYFLSFESKDDKFKLFSIPHSSVFNGRILVNKICGKELDFYLPRKKYNASNCLYNPVYSPTVHLVGRTGISVISFFSLLVEDLKNLIPSSRRMKNIFYYSEFKKLLNFLKSDTGSVYQGTVVNKRFSHLPWLNKSEESSYVRTIGSISSDILLDLTDDDDFYKFQSQWTSDCYCVNIYKYYPILDVRTAYDFIDGAVINALRDDLDFNRFWGNPYVRNYIERNVIK